MNIFMYEKLVVITRIYLIKGPISQTKTNVTKSYDIKFQQVDTESYAKTFC